MHAIGFGARFAVNRGVRPSTVFDFSRGVLPAGARLARASPATCYTASGAIVSVAADGARFDRDPVTGALRGLLIEPAATNLFARSTDWSDGYWLKSGVAASASVLTETTINGAHSVRQATSDINYVAGQAISVSLIAAERSGSAKRYLAITLGTVPAFSGSSFAIFDLANGAVTVAANCNAAATPAGGGAWLCVASATPVQATTGQQIVVRLNAASGAIASYVGDGTSGLSVTHVQIEAGATATSRIVTGATAETRAADVLTLDWRSRGVSDGAIGVRFGFDDGSSQDTSMTVASGIATVPVTLARRWITRVQKI
ncbi:hypothetical protein AB5I39_06290 [Sphingomonas sp. MMS24-J45]|uniref:phage head spike fiber domain-containing protein n=1 Tax=Sphingomonas sp. MMS24-J45 TaxID=3238806 RepID=UPI00384DC344